MQRKGSVFSLFVAILAVLSFTTSCFDQTTEERSAKLDPAASIEIDTARQKTVRLLASRLRWYHEFDSLAAAKPGSTDGDILTIGKKRFVFKTRKELRADLNRVLDSLHRTGPLIMGNISEETGTVPNTNESHSVRGKMTRRYQIKG